MQSIWFPVWRSHHPDSIASQAATASRAKLPRTFFRVINIRPTPIINHSAAALHKHTLCTNTSFIWRQQRICGCAQRAAPGHNDGERTGHSTLDQVNVSVFNENGHRHHYHHRQQHHQHNNNLQQSHRHLPEVLLLRFDLPTTPAARSTTGTLARCLPLLICFVFLRGGSCRHYYFSGSIAAIRHGIHLRCTRPRSTCFLLISWLS